MPDEWLAARKALLVKEKELTRARDALAANAGSPELRYHDEYEDQGPPLG